MITFGADAFRTATGVHAAAVFKAHKKDEHSFADAVYSGVSAHWFGKKQIIEIGPMSSASNIRFWLEENRTAATELLIKQFRAREKIISHPYFF